MDSIPDGFYFNEALGQIIEVRDLDGAQAQAYASLKLAREAAEYAPFAFNGVMYDAGQEDQRRIAGAMQLAMMAGMVNQPFSVDWSTHDNGTITLDGPSMLGLGQALGAAVEAVFARYRAAKDKVSAATTNVEADSVQF